MGQLNHNDKDRVHKGGQGGKPGDDQKHGGRQGERDHQDEHGGGSKHGRHDEVNPRKDDPKQHHDDKDSDR